MALTQQEQLSSLLTQGCDKLGLVVNSKQHAQLVTYTSELYKWNKTYNLTAIRDIEEIMKRHVIDALSIIDHVRSYAPQRIADIGTGGGIPGIIIAIMLPETQLFLVESIGKKCRFLRHIVNTLKLENRVTVLQERVEQWQPEKTMCIITCRAFSALSKFVHITEHLGDETTTWLAMKAAHTNEEQTELPNSFALSQDIVLNVPFEPAERHLIVLHKS